MISTIFQIAALAMIAVALFRESKRDLIKELRKKEELHNLFRSLRSDLCSVTSSIKAQIELTYAERFDSILKRLEYFGELIEVYVTQDAISKNEFSLTAKCVSDNNAMLSSIRAQVGNMHRELNSQLSDLNTRLVALETPVKFWSETQSQNEIRKGEANRTLLRRLQEKESVLVATRQTLKSQADQLADINSQLESTRSAASAACQYLVDEISATRAWLEERGIPFAPLDKHLAIHFKGVVPSSAHARVKYESDLKAALADSASNLSPNIQSADDDGVPSAC